MNKKACSTPTAFICEKLSEPSIATTTATSQVASSLGLVNSLSELTTGVYVALRAKENNKYVTLVNRWYGGKNLQASSPTALTKSEMFQLIRNTDSSFSLISAENGQMLTVGVNGAQTLQTCPLADVTNTNAEKFEFVRNDADATFSLRARANMKFISATYLDISPLQALFVLNVNHVHFFVENVGFMQTTTSSTTTTTTTQSQGKRPLSRFLKSQFLKEILIF